MILSAGVTSSWLSTRRFPAAVFEEARELSRVERYEESSAVLEKLLGETVCLASSSVGAAEVLVLCGWNLQNQMKYEELEQFLDQLPENALDDYPELNIVNLRLLVQTGQCREALEICECLQEQYLTPISPLLADLLYAKSMAQYKLGDLAGCVRDLEISYALCQLQKNEQGAALAGNYLGFVHSRLSDYRESIKWLTRSLPYFQNSGLLRRQSMVHLNLGITHYKRGDYSAAKGHLQQSLEIGIAGQWPHRQCFANIALGNVCRLNRDFTGARKHLHTAYIQAQKLFFPREEALALEFLGDVYRDDGAAAEARRFYVRALAIGQRIAPEGDIVMECHRRLGECFNSEGDQGQAAGELKQALKMAHAQGDRYEAAVTLRVMCETSLDAGDLPSARKYIDQSLAILSEIGAVHEWAVSLMSSATLSLLEVENPRTTTPRIVRLSQAWKQATRALDLLIKVDVRWWTAQARTLVSRISAVRDAQEKADRAARSSCGEFACGGYQPGEVIIHQSRVMRDMLQLCDMFASTEEPVLITGETGTGKEVVARRLHQRSERADGPLVVVNVAAIPETMFDREFFGHVRGAFSGAAQDRDGFAARADGGTLFLDEIGELPLDLQPKLLRLLQEGTYQALGDPCERRTNIRLVAATNANLEQRVKDGTFRTDLYYRLRTLDLPLPAVRERSEDVLPLVRHFLCVAAKQTVDIAEYFNRESMALLEDYDWPGNVREIAMVARQANISMRARGRVEVNLRPLDRPLVRLTGPGSVDTVSLAAGDEVAAVTAIKQSELVERSRILVALDECGGRRHLAAKSLGIGRSTLYRKMGKYGIPTRRV